MQWFFWTHFVFFKGSKNKFYDFTKWLLLKVSRALSTSVTLQNRKFQICQMQFQRCMKIICYQKGLCVLIDARRRDKLPLLVKKKLENPL